MLLALSAAQLFLLRRVIPGYGDLDAAARVGDVEAMAAYEEEKIGDGEMVERAACAQALATEAKEARRQEVKAVVSGSEQ